MTAGSRLQQVTQALRQRSGRERRRQRSCDVTSGATRECQLQHVGAGGGADGAASPGSPGGAEGAPSRRRCYNPRSRGTPDQQHKSQN
jgi:hypothetical protein